MIDKNTPAFPVPEYEGHNGERAFRSPVQEGMTYRQWLIGMALSKLAVHLPMKGMVSDGSTRDGLLYTISGECIDYADAIIDRLNKEDKQ